jgi:hypothetical protein
VYENVTVDKVVKREVPFEVERVRLRQLGFPLIAAH